MIGFTVCRKSRSNPTIQICLPFSYHPANPLSEFLLGAVFNLKKIPVKVPSGVGVWTTVLLLTMLPLR